MINAINRIIMPTVHAETSAMLYAFAIPAEGTILSRINHYGAIFIIAFSNFVFHLLKSIRLTLTIIIPNALFQN